MPRQLLPLILRFWTHSTIETAVAVNTAFYKQLNHFLLTICTHQVKGAQQCQVKEITF